MILEIGKVLKKLRITGVIPPQLPDWIIGEGSAYDILRGNPWKSGYSFETSTTRWGSDTARVYRAGEVLDVEIKDTEYNNSMPGYEGESYSERGKKILPRIGDVIVEKWSTGPCGENRHKKITWLFSSKKRLVIRISPDMDDGSFQAGVVKSLPQKKEPGVISSGKFKMSFKLSQVIGKFKKTIKIGDRVVFIPIWGAGGGYAMRIRLAT